MSQFTQDELLVLRLAIGNYKENTYALGADPYEILYKLSKLKAKKDVKA